MNAAIRRLGMVLMMLSAIACVAPEMRTRYEPLHPGSGVGVHFRVQATAALGIRKVELFLFEYEVADNAGSWSGSLRPGGRWGLVDTKEYTLPYPDSIDETFVQPGFPAASYVKYLFRVTQGYGATRSESWSFAAGEWSFGDDPIPILVRGEGGQGFLLHRIDLCFVADRDDYSSARSMLQDLSGLIYDGYQASNAQEGVMRFNWGYFYAPEMGHISTPFEGILDIPQSVESSSTIDAVAVIHTRDQKDWSSSNRFGTEPQNVGTALHETGHAVFSLDDEYYYYNDHGRHHSSSLPHHNNYDSRAAAEAYNLGMGWPASDAERIDAAGAWWRPEPQSLGCIMFDDLDDQLPDFGRTCILRIKWYYGSLNTLLIPGFQ